MIFVAIPVAARETVVRAAPHLHEPHAALQQPPGDQAIAAEIVGHRVVEAVELLRRRRFRRKIEHLRSAQLQPRRQFVRGDPRFEPRVARAATPHARAFNLLEHFQAVRFALRSDELARSSAETDRRSDWRCWRESSSPDARPAEIRPPVAGPLGANPRASGSTTNVGRLSFMLPRP